MAATIRAFVFVFATDTIVAPLPSSLAMTFGTTWRVPAFMLGASPVVILAFVALANFVRIVVAIPYAIAQSQSMDTFATILTPELRRIAENLAVDRSISEVGQIIVHWPMSS
jgi:hypothetical protein